MSDDRLTAAIAAHNTANPVKTHVRATGSVGELAVAEALDGATRRIVLVTGVDDATRTLRIALATNQTETATDLDVFVDRESSGAAFDLCIEGELYGPIFPEQLDDAVGSVALGLTGAIAVAVQTDGDSLQGYEVGLPLAGSADPRRSFKETELKDLMELVSACRQWIAGGRAEVTTLDPAVLLPPPVGTPMEQGFDRLDELIELLDTYEREGYLLSVDLRDWLHEVAAADLRRWHTEYGVDISTRLMLMALDDRPETLESPGSTDLRSVYLSSHARSGTVTVDFVTSRSHEWRESIVVESKAELTKSCRGRAVVMGASR